MISRDKVQVRGYFFRLLFFSIMVLFFTSHSYGELQNNYLISQVEKCDIQENALSCYHVGVAYGRGLGKKKDSHKAFEYFQKSCSGGWENGCMAVANYQRVGFKGSSEREKAFRYYKEACDNYIGRACGYIAFRDSLETLVWPKVDLVELFDQQRHGNIYAEREMVRLQTHIKAGQYEFPIHIWRKECHAGKLRSCANLGLSKMHTNDAGAQLWYSFPTQLKKEFSDALLKACEGNILTACVAYLPTGYAAIEDRKLDIIRKPLVKKACDLGNTHGCFEFALILSRLGYKDKKFLVTLLDSACTNQHHRACETAGRWHNVKHRQIYNKSKSRMFDERGCKLGNTWSCMRLQQ